MGQHVVLDPVCLLDLQARASNTSENRSLPLFLLFDPCNDSAANRSRTSTVSFLPLQQNHRGSEQRLVRAQNTRVCLSLAATRSWIPPRLCSHPLGSTCQPPTTWGCLGMECGEIFAAVSTWGVQYLWVLGTQIARYCLRYPRLRVS